MRGITKLGSLLVLSLVASVCLLAAGCGSKTPAPKKSQSKKTSGDAKKAAPEAAKADAGAAKADSAPAKKADAEPAGELDLDGDGGLGDLGAPTKKKEDGGLAE